ncbi:putative aspartic peptidase domain superfamily [Helianthus annuus]|nr:putative aspartic peptidase domain superfamily [Helianthus annuus]KAJ0519501.1 putative aspartic peptidase domain superfamily [Helianthus annuus]KAJ0687498.1 putative aspartic peptidase domain superfamily [Helianthus annuus]
MFIPHYLEGEKSENIKGTVDLPQVLLLVTNYNSKPSTVSAPTLPLLPTPQNKPLKTVRRLTTKEANEKRAKGECFFCPEKYSATHKCKNRQLFVIEIMDDESVEIEVEELEHNDPLENDIMLPHISIHAMCGIPSYSTMKVIGYIGTRKLHILIDSGSTHNFINEKLADKLQCLTCEVPAMRVAVANGKSLGCERVCNGFKSLMQGK